MLRGLLPGRVWLKNHMTWGYGVTCMCYPVTPCHGVTACRWTDRHDRNSQARCLSSSQPISKMLGLEQKKVELNISSFYKQPRDRRNKKLVSELSDIVIFTNHIQSCISPRDVLKGLPWDKLSVTHLYVICRKLNHFCSPSHPLRQENIHSLSNSKNLISVYDQLREQLDVLDSETVVEALSCVANFSPAKSDLLRMLEDKVLHLLNGMDLSCLVRLHGFVKNQSPTKNSDEITRKTQELIANFPISSLNPRELVSLFYWISQNPDTNFDIKKLDERALDLCDVMNIHQLRDVIFFLANQNHRNTTLLRAIGHCMAQQSFVILNIDHLCNLIYSCAKLSYCEENLMMLISSCIISKADTGTTPVTLVQILRSLSMLQWRHEELIDTVVSEAVRLDASGNDLANMMISAAQLNYAPSQLLQKVAFLPDASSTSAVQYLNTVWSAAVLGVATNDMISSVLDPSFIQSLQGMDRTLPDMTLIRLLNLNACSKYDLPAYTGPALPETVLNQSYKIAVKKNRPTHSCVVKALSNIAPEDKYWSQDVTTRDGYNIDIVLVLNEHGDPCLKSQYKHDQQLPEGYHRLAIKVLEYSDMTRCNVQPTGIHFMAVRHLHKAGYKVLQVPYDEFIKRKKIVDQVNYLQTAIKSIIKQ